MATATASSVATATATSGSGSASGGRIVDGLAALLAVVDRASFVIFRCVMRAK